MQGLFALLQALGPIASQGGDPSPVLRAASTFIKLRQQGVAVADAITQAFTPPAPPPEQQAPEQAPADPNAPPQGGGLEGVGANGLPTGVAPGQAGLPPGGRPDIQTLIAGMHGNSPTMSGVVTRKTAIGA